MTDIICTQSANVSNTHVFIQTCHETRVILHVSLSESLPECVYVCLSVREGLSCHCVLRYSFSGGILCRKVPPPRLSRKRLPAGDLTNECIVGQDCSTCFSSLLFLFLDWFVSVSFGAFWASRFFLTLNFKNQSVHSLATLQPKEEGLQDIVFAKRISTHDIFICKANISTWMSPFKP